ncbi:MAG: hypothetical protein QXR02_06660 [Acidilobaceae archaeon]
MSDNIDDGPSYSDSYAVMPMSIYGVYSTKTIRGLNKNRKLLKLIGSEEYRLMRQIKKACALLDVDSQTVMYDSLMMLRKLLDISKNVDIEALSLIVVYFSALKYGISVDYDKLRELIDDDDKLMKYLVLTEKNLKITTIRTVEMIVGEYASKLKMSDREYAQTLQLAQKISKIMGSKAGAIISTYLVYNTYSLINGRRTISMPEVDKSSHRHLGQIKKVEIYLG